MIEKHSNGLILSIIIIIIILGSIYYVKSTGQGSYSPSNITEYSQQSYENLNIIANNAYYENRAIIGNVSELPSTFTPQQSHEYNSRYYYNELSDCSKAMYDAIANNLNNIQRGKCTIQIDYDFNSLLNSKNGEELLDNYYNDAINAINLDIPNLFYLDFQKLYINIEKTSTIFSTKYKVFINSKDYDNFYINEFTSAAQVSKIINQIETIKNQVVSQASGNEYNRIRIVHDWLIDHMEYDNSSVHSANVYGGLIEKKGVCEAYARIYKYILDDIGIDNILVIGTATNSAGNTENHMWNYVKLYENWYAIDITWDDPIIRGTGIITEDYKHKYFLIRKSRIL